MHRIRDARPTRFRFCRARAPRDILTTSALRSMPVDPDFTDYVFVPQAVAYAPDDTWDITDHPLRR